jgi:hypothetical protein
MSTHALYSSDVRKALWTASSWIASEIGESEDARECAAVLRILEGSSLDDVNTRATARTNRIGSPTAGGLGSGERSSKGVAAGPARTLSAFSAPPELDHGQVLSSLRTSEDFGALADAVFLTLVGYLVVSRD